MQTLTTKEIADALRVSVIDTDKLLEYLISIIILRLRIKNEPFKLADIGVISAGSDIHKIVIDLESGKFGDIDNNLSGLIKSKLMDLL